MTAFSPFRRIARSCRSQLLRLVARSPSSIGRLLPRRFWTPPPGTIDFGDFGRTEPISVDFGFDRGVPIDRYFIERFLERNSSIVCGRVLEIGDNEYTLRFGGSQVEKSDVLHVDATHPAATIVGDISVPGTLPDRAFDCIILTQTLHLIFDMRGALAELARALKPGGTLLITVPGISPVDRGTWRHTWYWSLTENALEQLLASVLAEDGIEVETFGNVFAATCFLQGLSLSEVPPAKLDVLDKAFPLIVAAAAKRLPQ
ncbi:methyltransferase domain-containing protein [Bradyrhizobium yuanmingense]|uniref:class I SAM-dependent methyltransferase n=1 Tax=Bradyrhizobium yuanmingense TaxID=108015 RepID=UPI0023B9B247|nr:methyltransferase domain-containing protein [Bradyrhizobium yuanmingense]MDF0516836.1 methyltransferase domain-containing protein [Bradyrhizobium yuanmingense]